MIASGQDDTALTDAQRAALQREAAALYDAGRMDDCRLVLERLGGTSFGAQLSDLIDGAVMNDWFARHPRQS